MKWKLPRQIIMMSKYTLIGIFSQCLLVGMLMANTSSGQNKSLNEVFISVSLNHVKVKKAFSIIGKKSGFEFTYFESAIDGEQEVTVKSENISVGDLLKQISSSTDLQFKRVNAKIYVKKKAAQVEAVVEEAAVPQQVRISGKVTAAEDGEPLPGVSILVKGTSTGTTTDVDGNYSLSAPEGSTLQFSYIGFTAQEIVVGNQTTLNIALQPDLEQLEEVVVVGYGTVKKSDLTGSVANVKGDALENLPTPRVDQLLAGRMAGVNVTSTSGEPGAPASIRIRGGNSITGNNEPLYVIDGYIAGQDFDLNTINVNDIKSLEVLKDASSLAIYGTRGANGVILITTKSGKGLGGTPKVSVNFYHGRQSTFNEIDYIDGDQYRSFRQQGGDPFFDNLTGNENWFENVTQTGQTSNMDVSVRGSNKNTNYFISSNYFNQKGIIKESGLERYTFRTNLDIELSPIVKVGTRTNLSYQSRDLNRVNFAVINNEALPLYPEFNDDGSFASPDLPSGDPFDNPSARIAGTTNQRSVTDVLTNFYLEITPLEGLVIKSTLAPRLIWRKDDLFRSSVLTNDAPSIAQVSNRFTTDILQENTISYSKTFNDSHNLNLLGGFTWQTSDTEATQLRGNALALEQFGVNGLSSSSPETLRATSSFPNPFQLVSWLARANYSYKGKYLLTLTGRVDGSSRFATSNNEYAFFPAAAVAWNIKEESFLSDVSAISKMKLRGSYGESGSQSIASFQALATYRGNGPISFNNIPALTQTPGTPANSDLKWETTSQLDIGFEAGLFNDRIVVEFDYYIKETNDLLLRAPLARQTGFSSAIRNVGSLENRGVELSISGVIVDKQDFTWNANFTISRNVNEVTQLAEDDVLPTTGFIGAGFASAVSAAIVGEHMSSFYGLQYLGVWNQSDIDAATEAGILPGGVQLGDPRFLDVNGDGAYTFQDDYQVIGVPEPDFYWGLNNTLKYKNFSLDFLLQGTQGNDIFNVNSAHSFFDLTGRANLYPEVLNAWTPTNTETNVPRSGIRPAVIDGNSALVEDGSHIRLRNIRLGYTLTPENSFFESLNIYVAGANLFLITADGFRGIDPEANDTFDSRSLGQVNRGFISNAYPSARTFTVGFNATF